MQLYMQRDRRGDRPWTVEQLAVGVHVHDVARAQLVPRQPERVDEEGPVRLFVGDVAGEMVVVPLAVQHPCQQREFGGGRELRQWWCDLAVARIRLRAVARHILCAVGGGGHELTPTGSCKGTVIFPGMVSGRSSIVMALPRAIL